MLVFILSYSGLVESSLLLG